VCSKKKGYQGTRARTVGRLCDGQSNDSRGRRTKRGYPSVGCEPQGILSSGEKRRTNTKGSKADRRGVFRAGEAQRKGTHSMESLRNWLNRGVVRRRIIFENYRSTGVEQEGQRKTSDQRSGLPRADEELCYAKERLLTI